MQLYFQPFYRQHGIRRVSQMLAPRLALLRFLPRDSIIHYLSSDHDNPDIDVSKPYYGQDTKKIVVDYVDTLISTEHGHPRRKQIMLRPMVREFHKQHKKFRYVPDALTRINDQNTLFVLNYSYLDKIYVYPVNPLRDWYHFFNSFRTIFGNISKISETKLKNHFVFIDLPKDLPSYSMLNMFTGKVSRTVLRLFNGNEELFMLQCWQWLSDKNRESTIFGDLKPEDYSKTNLVFTSVDGRSVVMNLGYIDSWIKGHEQQAEGNDKSQLKPVMLQKLYLKLNMTLKSINPEEDVGITVVEGEEAVKPIEDKDEEKDIQAETKEYEEDNDDSHEDSVDGHEYSNDFNSDGISNFTKSSKPTPNEDVRQRQKDIEKDIDASLIQNLSLDAALKDIDKDLEMLDRIMSKRMKDKGIRIDREDDMLEPIAPIIDIPVEVIHAKIYQPENYEDSLKRQIDENADFNLIGAAEYKKLHADIDKYKQSKDPYGSGRLTIEEMKVEPHHIAIHEDKVKINTIKPLVDPTLASSTLQVFHEDYIKNVKNKDTLAMVNHLQKAGVVIRSHEIEHDHSVLGSYENHTFELKPIDGQVSTLRVRLPVVGEDGSFQANGSKYQLRLQRVELPIRKINPTTVALTSYYGQTFVSINEKATSFLKWLERQLNLASMDDTHPFITQVAPSNVFDNKFIAPYIYNALSSIFKSITTKDFYLSFDHTERLEMTSPEIIKMLEKNGSSIVGLTKTKQPIVVDEKNIFYYFDSKNLIPMGDIVSILKLPADKAPIDHTDVRVYGKNVPVGVILAYNIGFVNLVKFLGAKHKVVEGKRVGDLEPHEYVISFADRKYIFDRREKTASLILAGFNEYEKEVKQYKAEEFEKKNVYLNLLETKGLGSIYIREIESVQQLFIDPITHSILESMKEPVTFNGLLMRSTELLQTYHHPDPQDTNYMRFRGYERFPGAIYSQLCTQIRAYKNKNIAGKSKIEMSPYQVWQYVMKDSAIKLVEDINPIQNLKESEIVTLVGNGGRNKDAINRENRAYHENDMGVVSEATVDSSDVGINTYLSANPNFANLRGIVKPEKDFTPANILSTSALLAPGVTHDD